MSIEQILALLRARVAAKVSLPKFHTSAKGRDTIKAMMDKANLLRDNTIALSRLVYEELNQILLENNISFPNEKEKKAFILRCKPGIVDIMKRHITV